MQVLNGFVKIHRKLIQWGWYKNDIIKSLFIHLLLSASFKDTLWEGQTIKRGQLVTSYTNLASDIGHSVQEVRTALRKLKSTGEITVESTNKYTIITVVNWEEYQFLEDSSTGNSTQSSTNKQTNNSVFCEQIMNKIKNAKNSTHTITSRKELENIMNHAFNDIEKILSTSSATNEQQTTNKQLTNNQQHRKNVKEYKECKEKKKGPCGPDFWGLTFDDEEEGEGNDQEGDVRPAKHH